MSANTSRHPRAVHQRLSSRSWASRARRRRELRGQFERLEPRHLLAVFTVNTTDDSIDANPGDGFALDDQGRTSLRAAIMETNALAGEDSILLPAGTYRFTRSGTNEEFASTGDLDIRDHLVITGVGAGLSVIDANLLDRIAEIHGQETRVLMQSLTLTRGHTPYNSGYGAVANNGNLTLDSVVVSHSRSEFGGGSLTTTPGSILRVSRSLITDNLSDYGGGGLFIWGNARVIVEDSAIVNNSADNGGGIQNGYPGYGPGGSTLIVNTTISGNHAIFGGGGISHGNSDSPMTLINCTVTGNRVDIYEGGGLRVWATLLLENTIVAGNSGIGPRANAHFGQFGLARQFCLW